MFCKNDFTINLRNELIMYKLVSGFIIIVAVFFITSCSSLQVTKLEEVNAKSKEFVYLSNSRWDSKMRIALQKKGFKVKRFSSQSTVIGAGNEGEIARITKEAAAIYGIELALTEMEVMLYMLRYK